MLTEEEKQKIRLEEAYRHEIKQQQEKKPGMLARIFGFLNSNFASFLLSTVIVGAISVKYNEAQQDRLKQEKMAVESAKKNQDRHDLYNELIHRLEVMETTTDTLLDYEFYDIHLAYRGMTISKDRTINYRYYNFRSFHKKFEDWSLVRVLEELMLLEEKNLSLLKELRTALDDCAAPINKLGEQWQVRTRDEQFIDGLRWDKSRRVYRIKTTEEVYPFVPANLPFTQVWVAEDKKPFEQLIGVIDELKEQQD